MWMSERGRMLPVEEPAAEMGLVTMGGDPAGVYLGGERRWMPVCCPGGYSWRPAAGDKVLVLKAGAERESACILGMARTGTDLQPGEVRLTGTDSAVTLRSGQVRLDGTVMINGTDLETYIRNIVAAILAAML